MLTSAKSVRPIQFITSPFVRFAGLNVAGGMVLCASTIAALIWANSPWQHGYEQLLQTQVSVGFGNFVITENRHEWINDGLMSLFFFLIGLEIKRELLVGELSSLRRAALPLVAAIGGVIAPAFVYLTLTHGSTFAKGWAIPIATDIAFVLGILAFVGSRVPVALKVFVTALAIVDDIIAVIVIAVFYTGNINYFSLAMGFGCVLVSLLANVLGVRKPVVYAIIGIFAWCAVLNSGVHATIAGILLAFTIPARTALDKREFLDESRSLLDRLELVPADPSEESAIIRTLEEKIALVDSPLHRIERRLHPWIAFFVMPLFALANAGVNLSDNVSAAIKHPISLGVILGLIIGKPAGIWLFSVLAVKSRIAVPLAEISSLQVFGAACLCGIGFTMSLFVAGLAFGEGQSLEVAKIAILVASAASAIFGWLLLTRKSETTTALSRSELQPQVGS
jgi:NhaA family Na+:H+ antiporter